MKIGISGPILTSSFKVYLHEDSYRKCPKGMGGTAVNKLILALLDKGYSVSVYTLDPSINKPISVSGKKLKIYFGVYRKRGYKRLSDFFYFESKQIKEFIIKDKPDIVNAHWGYEFAVGTILSNFPNLITLRDAPKEILYLKKDIYRLVRYFINIWVMNKGNNFSVNSPYLKNKLNYFKKEMVVIPNFIDELIEDLEPKKLNNIKIVSLLNGWGERKNPKSALKAFNLLLRKTDLKLEYHLFGPDYGHNQIAFNWASNNGLNKNCFFHGEVDHNKLMNMLPQYDILLHPAKEESFGNSLIEAMAKGLPVIGGKNSGAVPWVLNYGKNGILVDVQNVNEICDALLILIKETEYYNELRISSLEYVKNSFSKDVVLKNYLENFKKIIKDYD